MPTAEITVADGRERWPRRLDAQHDNTDLKDLTDYIVYKIEEYSSFNFRDDTLWEAFKDDFEIYTVDSFKDCNQNVTRNLRDFLRHREVWI